MSPVALFLLLAVSLPLPSHERTVKIDVKDEDVHKILATMQKQCGVKNLIIDPDVQVRGTFVFHDVPCSMAFKVVFRTLGLSSVDYGNSVITVGTRKLVPTGTYHPVPQGTDRR
jgi:hypothetical protein